MAGVSTVKYFFFPFPYCILGKGTQFSPHIIGGQLRATSLKGKSPHKLLEVYPARIVAMSAFTSSWTSMWTVNS